MKTLTEAGTDARLAEAFVSVARDASARADLVTSADLRTEIAGLRADLTWRMLGWRLR